jgi:hypothetical protein
LPSIYLFLVFNFAVAVAEEWVMDLAVVCRLLNFYIEVFEMFLNFYVIKKNKLGLRKFFFVEFMFF